EDVDLFVAAVARSPPSVRFARNRHIGSSGEGQVGPMPRATSFLEVAALAVVLEDGFAARFITDRAARASAAIGLGHCHSPTDCYGRDQADFGLAKTSRPWPVSSKDFRLASTTGQPLLMPIAIP